MPEAYQTQASFSRALKLKKQRFEHLVDDILNGIHVDEPVNDYDCCQVDCKCDEHPLFKEATWITPNE